MAGSTKVDASTSTAGALPHPPVHTSDTFRPLLKQLILSLPVPGVPQLPTRPLAPSLSRPDLGALFAHLSDPAFTSNHANQAQLGSVLSGMRLGGIDASSETLAIASETFIAKCVAVQSLDEDPAFLQKRRQAAAKRVQEEGWMKSVGSAFAFSEEANYTGTLDLVGTGGDGQDTFNVSTTAAIVASGVPGVRICKHGAKASSSTSGSADLLLSLGIPLLSLSPSIISKLLPTSTFTFLFAQLFHPALAPLAPIRRALGHPTIFNVLGPLINPARPRRCILGVHSAYLGEIFASALRQRGCEKAWVVCGKEGLDEISIEGETDVWELSPQGEITHFTVSPASFGIDGHPLSAVASCSSQENAAIVLHMVQPGKEASTPANAKPLAEELRVVGAASTEGASSSPSMSLPLPAIPAGTDVRAIMDYTLLQTAALLYVGGYSTTLEGATSLARFSLNSGAALHSLDSFRAEAKETVARAEEEQEQEQAQARADAEAKEQSRKDVGDAVDRRKDEYFYAPEPVRSVGVGTSD